MIEVTNLTKAYGETLAVDDLTFTVRPGIVTGFLGAILYVLLLTAVANLEKTVFGFNFQSKLGEVNKISNPKSYPSTKQCNAASESAQNQPDQSASSEDGAEERVEVVEERDNHLVLHNQLLQVKSGEEAENCR